MNDWYSSAEFEMPVWVRDLDDDTYGVDHRRLCVWADEFDASWHWEVQTYADDGVAGNGVCADRQAAMAAAEAAAGIAAAGSDGSA